VPKEEAYMRRLNRHERAFDLLVGNRVILPGDVRVTVCFVDRYFVLKKVVSGICLEQYFVDKFLLDKELVSMFDQVLVYFVDLKSRTYKEATSEQVLANLGDLLPRRIETGQDPCYLVHLGSEFKAFDLPQESPR